MPARVRLCARCRNHNEKNLVKDHKDQCKYKDCKCVNCILILQRQQVQGKLKRLQSSNTGQLMRKGAASTRAQSTSVAQRNHNVQQEPHRRLRRQHDHQPMETARQLQYQLRVGSSRERSTTSSPIRESPSGLASQFGSTLPTPSGLPLHLQLLDSSLRLSLGSPLAGSLAALGQLASLTTASNLVCSGTSGGTQSMTNRRALPSPLGELQPPASDGDRSNVEKKNLSDTN